MSQPLPTGEQHTICRGLQKAVVTEVGATLREYSVDGVDVLDPFPQHEISDSHGQTLIPWPNRVAGSAYGFRNNWYTLPMNQPGDDAAIHGLVRFRPWKVEDRGEDYLVMVHTLWPSPGYPFTLHSQVEFRLTDEGLSVAYEVRNVGAESLPVGIGTHPYFTIGTKIDGAELTVPAETMLITNGQGIPTGRTSVEGTPFDFREPRMIGGTVLDTPYTDLARDENGKAQITLALPDRSRVVHVRLGPECRFVQIYSGDTLPNPHTRRKSLAIEPMTCPANAFNSGDGLVVLEPGEHLSSSWEALSEHCLETVDESRGDD